jgi:hypothetical protein
MNGISQDVDTMKTIPMPLPFVTLGHAQTIVESEEFLGCVTAS